MILAKKGQTELLGFVMVVALVSIAILFVVGFLVKASQTDVRADFIDKQLAVNLNDAILETSTMCRGIPVRDLLLDCATDQYLQCGGSSSCAYLRDEVYPEILNITLGEEGRNVSFMYRACIQQSRGDGDCFAQSPSAPNQLISITNGNCSRSSIIPGIFPLPTRSGKIVYSVLQICR